MRRAAWVLCLGTVSLALCGLCGCFPRTDLEEWFPSRVPTLPSNVALDRALRLCALVSGDQPFHLILEIPSSPAHPGQYAQVEVFWLNPITYRTEIRSRAFTQTRIVNGEVVEEHDSGDFYPRWIQNLVDAILAPVPNAPALSKISGVIPVDAKSQACISDPFDPPDSAVELSQACLAGADPKLTSGRSATRYVSFDDFQPFGSRQIARTMVNTLPDNTMIRARVLLLEALSQSDYPRLKAMEFTPPEKQIATAFTSSEAAGSSLLQQAPLPGRERVLSRSASDAFGPVRVYIRADRSGRVREAYRDNADRSSLQDPATDPAVTRALALKFKPCVVDGIPRQMEATIQLP